jgi:hypothetical protein
MAGLSGMGDITSHLETLRGFVKPELCRFVSESSRKLRQHWPRFFQYFKMNSKPYPSVQIYRLAVETLTKLGLGENP